MRSDPCEATTRCVRCAVPSGHDPRLPLLSTELCPPLELRTRCGKVLLCGRRWHVALEPECAYNCTRQREEACEECSYTIEALALCLCALWQRTLGLHLQLYKLPSSIALKLNIEYGSLQLHTCIKNLAVV